MSTKEKARVASEHVKSLEQDLAKAQAESIKDAVLEQVASSTARRNELTVSIEKIQNEQSSVNAAVARGQAEEL